MSLQDERHGKTGATGAPAILQDVAQQSVSNQLSSVEEN